MKKCLGYIGVAVLAVILAGAIICAFLGVDILFSPEGASVAVSVIGGADGPTSIFLAGKLSYGDAGGGSHSSDRRDYLGKKEKIER